MTVSFYDLLGVPHDVDSVRLRAAFRALALQHHPDKQSQPQGSSAQFLTIQRAYQVLSNPHLRQVHDRELQLDSMRQCKPFLDELHVSEMQECQEGGLQGFTYDCRCGGSYWLPRSDIAAAVQHMALPCDSCSYYILVDITGVQVDLPSAVDSEEDSVADDPGRSQTTAPGTMLESEAGGGNY